MYSVLFDKAKGNLMLKVKNEQRGGFFSDVIIHKWFTETSGEGLARQREYLLHPPTAKKEKEIYELVEKWKRELSDLQTSRKREHPRRIVNEDIAQEDMSGETSESMFT